MYYGGVSEGITHTAVAAASSVETMAIGPTTASTDEWAGCKVTEVRFWDDVRTTTELQEHSSCQLSCADGSACTGPETRNLFYYWPANENTGTTANDLTTSGVDFTLDSASTWSTDAPTFANDDGADCWSY